MTALTFTVNGTPQAQGSMRHVGNGRMIHKPELLQWRNMVNLTAVSAARQNSITLPLDGPLYIAATFYLPKPARPRFDVPATKPDLDKLTRAIGDALSPKTGQRVIAEDSRIVKWEIEKKYAAPGRERAEIVIVPQEVPF